MNRKTELLAPAGCYETLKAVVNAGADAVYAAGTRFGARAYADNFTTEELLDAIDELHLKEKKLYLTVNTVLKELEIASLYEYLLPLYQAGLDAVIVQDIGVMRLIREQFPGLAIHASTQTTVTGAYGAKLLLNAGCSRIVTARELSLEEISHIFQTTGAEIESFVHGALCYCYSGQCLLSSIIGGRSGNRGRCAQPCRLSYEMFASRKEAETRKKHKEQYPLSPKDLCAIDLIPELIESGVHSFKIEGRMKQAEYAAGVTSVYRKYLDLYESGGFCKVTEQDRQLLLDLGNRCGFTNGYYQKQNGRDMVTFVKPSHQKQNDSLHEHVRSKYLDTENKEKIKGNLRLSAGNPASLVLQYKEFQVQASGDVAQPAKKQPLSLETVLDKMHKTGSTPFTFQELEVQMEQGIFLPVQALNQLRRVAIEKLQNAILEKYRRSKAAISESAKKKALSQKEKTTDKTFLSVLTETTEQFEISLEQPEPERIYLEAFAMERKNMPKELQKYTAMAQKARKECYLALPYVFRWKTAKWFEQNWQKLQEAKADGYLVRNLEELSFLLEMGVHSSCIQGDYGLYADSNQAVLGWKDLSLEHYTMPIELNHKEWQELDARNAEILLYGYQPLMISAQCLRKNLTGCDKKKEISYLKDRYGKLFPVKNRCEDCYNVIYNISPLALFSHLQQIKALHPASIRLSFTLEERREVLKVFEYLRQAQQGSLDRGHYFKEFTNGHYKRGVE